MDEKALARAKDNLRRASQKLDGMKASKSLDELADCWRDFLVCHNRVFTQLDLATRDGESKGWFDKIKNERRTDELLCYVRHARNADEHGIEQITVQKEGGLHIGPGKGGSSHIRSVAVIKGKVDVVHTGARPNVSWNPGGVHPATVTDRGTEYAPPAEHLGEALGAASLLDIAEKAHAYLNEKIRYTESSF